MTQRGAPSPGAIRPSPETAIFSCTKRPVPGHAQDVAGRHPARLLRAQPESTATPASRSTAKPRPAISGLGSSIGAHHAADAGGDDGVGARRRAAVMRAGLQRDVHGLAPGPRAGAGQRVPLRVRAAALLRPAARDHLAGGLVGDDGADGRVGRGAAQHATRHAQRQLMKRRSGSAADGGATISR